MASEADGLTTPKPGSRMESSEFGDDNDMENASNIGDLNEIEEGTELNDDIKAFKEEINKLVVDAPAMHRMPDPEFRPEDYPQSYKENSPKEKLVLQFAENFRRQYVHLYRDRKPLFLNPYNECNVEKFVCTSLQPTLLPFTDLYNWDGAAEFVSDYLNFELLEPPHELPTRLLSSMTVLKRQKGTCFEYSTLLCSLLLGAGYDAYVVSGYASKDVCLMDETREICPLLKKREKMPVLLRKYFVPPDVMKLEIQEESDTAAGANVFDLGEDAAQELHDKFIYQRDTIARIKLERKATAEGKDAVVMVESSHKNSSSKSSRFSHSGITSVKDSSLNVIDGDEFAKRVSTISSAVRTISAMKTASAFLGSAQPVEEKGLGDEVTYDKEWLT